MNKWKLPIHLLGQGPIDASRHASPWRKPWNTCGTDLIKALPKAANESKWTIAIFLYVNQAHERDLHRILTIKLKAMVSYTQCLFSLPSSSRLTDKQFVWRELFQRHVL